MPDKLNPAKKKKAGLNRLPVAFICVCVLPTLLLTVTFIIIPTLRALWMSFSNSTALGLNSKFVWFENYQYMFRDESFLQAMGNTFKLLAVVPAITIIFALVLAFMLSQTKLRERGFYRTVFYFPNIISLTVVGVIWSFVFHPNMGIVNTFLKFIGLDALTRPWVGDARTSLWCIAVTLVWQATGYYMIMHMAAMDGISNEIYEAATIDGASSFRKFASITVPLMRDIIGITFVLAMSGTMNLSFVLSKVMTGGGPNGASTVLLQYMYEQGFVNGNFGYAMAITVFSLTISVLLSMLSRRLSNREEKK